MTVFSLSENILQFTQLLYNTFASQNGHVSRFLRHDIYSYPVEILFYCAEFCIISGFILSVLLT